VWRGALAQAANAVERQPVRLKRLRHLIELKEPATGEIIYGDINFTRAEPAQRERLLRRLDQQHHCFLLANPVWKLSGKQHP
jgi:hypothetical protein